MFEVGHVLRFGVGAARLLGSGLGQGYSATRNNRRLSYRTARKFLYFRSASDITH